MSAARLVAISGIGCKGPACFLVEAEGRRILFDLGEGPDAGLLPDVGAIGRVDAVVLSHGHPDHVGGLHLLSLLGTPPVHATPGVLERLEHAVDGHPLPSRGEVDLLGLRLRTGRSGHAPGGVWLHLDVGDGFLYLGDACLESMLYAFDPPPPAATVVLDASYGAYDAPLSDCMAALAPWLRAPAVLLPVPAGGRGPEIALHLLASGLAAPALDAANRQAVERLLGPDRPHVRDEAVAGLERLRAEARVAEAAGPPAGVILAAEPNATGGHAAVLAERTRGGTEPAIVFTGHVGRGTPAERLVAEGRAVFRRWNVHPRLSDNAALVRATGARRVVPAFGDARHLEVWRRSFAPAAVLLDRVVAL